MTPNQILYTKVVSLYHTSVAQVPEVIVKNGIHLKFVLSDVSFLIIKQMVVVGILPELHILSKVLIYPVVRPVLIRVIKEDKEEVP